MCVFARVCNVVFRRPTVSAISDFVVLSGGIGYAVQSPDKCLADRVEWLPFAAAPPEAGKCFLLG